PQGSRVAVRQDRFRPVLLDQALPAVDDEIQCLVPRDRREPPLSLRSDAPHRLAKAVRVEQELQVAVGHGPEAAAGLGWVGVALNADRPPVLDRDDPAAGVGTVVGTDALEAGGPG